MKGFKMKKILIGSIIVLTCIVFAYRYFNPSDRQIRNNLTLEPNNIIVVESVCDYLRDGKTIRSKSLGKTKLIGVDYKTFKGLADSRCNQYL